MDYISDPPAEYKYQDALSLPAVTDLYREEEHWADVFVEPPGTARFFERPLPAFLADPDHVGLFADLTNAVFSSPPAFVARARGARIVGFRTVLARDGVFFNDDSLGGEKGQQEFLSNLVMPDPLNEETGIRRLRGSQLFAFDQRGRRVQQIPGTTVLLSSAEPSNYGSWLFRVLPKLQTLKRHSAETSVNLGPRFLVWAGVPAFQEYLRILGIPKDRIIPHDPKNVVYELETAIVPSIRNNQAYLDIQTLALYTRLREELGSPQQPGNRIYVSRHLQRASSRAMQNEAELIDRLRAMNFHIICPEKLSVPEQVRTFSSAEMVVGPSGSGMFNIIFCHPGTRVIDIESEPHWIHAHLCLFASCRLRYGIFVGKAVDQDFTTHHKPWRVNVEALVKRIEGFD